MFIDGLASNEVKLGEDEIIRRIKLTSLRLQFNQMIPYSPGGLTIIVNFGVRMQTKHFRCVGEGQRVRRICYRYKQKKKEKNCYFPLSHEAFTAHQ